MKGKLDCLVVGLSPAIQKTLVFKTFETGEVNRSEKYYIDSSGKCINVCRVLSQGGMSSSCLTIAGVENRAYFEDLCHKDSLDVTTIKTPGRVRVCTTIVDKTKPGFVTELVVNEPELITSKEEHSVKSSFLEKIDNNYSCLIISGSKIEGFSDSIVPFMVKTAKDRGMKVFADFRGKDLKNSFNSETDRPDYIKINKDEFFETFEGYSTLKEGLKDISHKYQCTFIITRGADSTLAANEGEIFQVESTQIQALNPIGCGDSMTAGLAQGILEGLPLKESINKGRDYATLNALSIHPGWILEK